MTPQVKHALVRKVIPRLAAVCLLSLYSSVALAQSSDSKPDPVATLRTARLIYVDSSTLLVGASVVEEKLQKRAEFSQMGLAITREPEAADIILELHHDVFTKFVYTALDRRTRIVLASGKLSSLGGTVAGKVAKRFLKQMMEARASAPTPRPLIQ